MAKFSNVEISHFLKLIKLVTAINTGLKVYNNAHWNFDHSFSSVNAFSLLKFGRMFDSTSCVCHVCIWLKFMSVLFFETLEAVKIKHTRKAIITITAIYKFIYNQCSMFNEESQQRAQK